MEIKLDLKGDGAWEDVAEDIEGQAVIERIAVLRGGMESGKSSVAFLVRTSEGKLVMAETSMALFATIARAILTVEAVNN